LIRLHQRIDGYQDGGSDGKRQITISRCHIHTEGAVHISERSGHYFDISADPFFPVTSNSVPDRNEEMALEMVRKLERTGIHTEIVLLKEFCPDPAPSDENDVWICRSE